MNKLKILLLSLICLFPLAMSAEKTVYFEKPADWKNEIVKIHYWGNSETVWPGVACENIEGTNIWGYVLPDGITGIIFNNDEQPKTSDITDIVDGHLYKSDCSHTVYTGTPLVPTERELYMPEFYLVGAHSNNWNFMDEYKFTLDEATKTYTLTLSEFGISEFKIAEKGWTGKEVSTGGEVAVNAEPVEINRNDNNMHLSEKVTNVTFTLVYTADNYGTLQVQGTVEGTVVELPTLYLRGDINEWKADEAYKFNLDESTRTYTLELSSLSGYFKIGTGEDENWVHAFGYNDAIDNGTTVVLNDDLGNNISLKYRMVNVTLTMTYSTSGVATLNVEGTPVESVYTFFYNNSKGWQDVYAYVYTGGNSNDEALGVWPGKQLTNKITIDGTEYYVGTFKTLSNSHKIIFNKNGKDNENDKQTGDLDFVNNGIYNFGGHTGDVHTGAVIFGIKPQTDGIFHTNGVLEGEIAANEFTIKVTTTEHHTVHYAFTPSSPAAAPAREAAEGTTYTEAENGVITVPATTGNLAIVTHDGEGYSEARNVEVRVSDTTGIENIAVEGTEAAEYYNLQGVRVASPAKGIYIVRRGNTATKQYIR